MLIPVQGLLPHPDVLQCELVLLVSTEYRQRIIIRPRWPNSVSRVVSRRTLLTVPVM
jgi:hypothetical protein